MKRATGLCLIATIVAVSGILSLPQNNVLQAAGPEKKDSIIIQKTNNKNNKKHQVNIYANTSQKVLFFSARGENDRIYKLLLFKEGRLIKQIKVRNRETTVVIKPEKGNYYYEVLTDDEHIESGTITVK